MKQTIFILTIILLSSCLTVHHRKFVLNPNDCGDRQLLLKPNGYFYSELKENAFPFYKNKYGGYSEDSSSPYNQKQIRPYIFYADGSLLTFGTKSGFKENLAFDYSGKCNLTDENTIDRAKLYFQCDIKNYKDRYPVWGKGIYKTDQHQIKLQYYINWMGEYYLIEKSGEIINDSTFILKRKYDYKLKQEQVINEKYKFQQFDIKPKAENYILKHKKRFKQNGR